MEGAWEVPVGPVERAQVMPMAVTAVPPCPGKAEAGAAQAALMAQVLVAERAMERFFKVPVGDRHRGEVPDKMLKPVKAAQAAIMPLQVD